MNYEMKFHHDIHVIYLQILNCFTRNKQNKIWHNLPYICSLSLYIRQNMSDSEEEDIKKINIVKRAKVVHYGSLAESAEKILQQASGTTKSDPANVTSSTSKGL